MKKMIFAVSLLLILTNCGSVNTDPAETYQETRVVEPTAKFYLATGGVASGRDELVIYDANGEPQEFSENELDCSASKYLGKEIVLLAPRPEYDSISAGSGLRIIPSAVGYVSITCTKGGLPLGNPYEAIVAPQSLIQILLAEAGEQIGDEASIDENTTVALNSKSITAEAIAYVVKNRIEYDMPELFEANEDEYRSDPPESYYNAIITAPDQFSPLDPEDPTNAIYNNAQDRNFLINEKDWRIAYDQAVLSAAQVFVEDVTDPTGGAFGFRSPTDEEWAALKTALETSVAELPADGGITDADYPFFSGYLQVLIQPDVWKYSDGKPSFVFVRKKLSRIVAVTDVP